jgi:hypothetical protein
MGAIRGNDPRKLTGARLSFTGQTDATSRAGRPGNIEGSSSLLPLELEAH